MKTVKALIQAGGQGTRLRPVTLEIPKPLLTVKRKPIINHLINFFQDAGIEDVKILIHKDHSDDYDWWLRRYNKELPKKIKIHKEEESLGTFGGLRDLRHHFKTTFVMSNADELKHFNLKDLINFHRGHPRKPIATIALVKVAEPSHYGVPVMKGDLIKEFLEKPNNPPTNFISSGLYVLEPEIFNYADWEKKFLMIEKDIFPKLAAAGLLAGYKVKNSRWYDCGTFERWEKAIKEW